MPTCLTWISHILYLIYYVNNRCICISNICVCRQLHSPVYQQRELDLSEIILLNRIITVLHSFLAVRFCFCRLIMIIILLFLLHQRHCLDRINLTLVDFPQACLWRAPTKFPSLFCRCESDGCGPSWCAHTHAHTHERDVVFWRCRQGRIWNVVTPPPIW